MRAWGIGVICLACVLLIGCEEQQAAKESEKNIDVELVNTINNIQVENALITQHTLYPYDFVTDGAALNDLGQRDLAVLARHYKENPGVLNVRQGKTTNALYAARVAQVKTALKEAGVNLDRMTISDGLPGGPGMRTEEMITTRPKTTGGGSSSMGGSSGSISK
jgi:hypothetical protein